MASTYFLSDGTDEVAEYDSSGNLTAINVPGPAIDQPIAVVTGSAAPYTHHYFHTNRQGSVIAMSDDSGAKVEGPYVYDPYGNCFSGGSACSSSGEPYRFTGRRLDPETGLLYYRARYYWPQGGRFLQTDPVGYDADLNLYTYVGNDPTDRTDALGLYNCSDNPAMCDKVEKSVQAAHKALSKMDPQSRAARRLALALKTLGSKNDNNNVNITFDGSKSGAGFTNFNEDTGIATVHLAQDFGSKATDPKGNATNEGAGIISHEGDHISHLMALGNPTTEQEDWDLESGAYNLQSIVEKALGNPDSSHGWSPSQTTESDRQKAVVQHTKASVSDWCADNPACGNGKVILRVVP